jgi:hypothetical protein
MEVPANRAFYSKRLDLRDSLGVLVDVDAGVDVVTHEAFWILRAVDPATGQTPENPLLGLLPVNDALHRGEGFVSYTVGTLATVASGDSLRAKATIVFDNNDPIDTPEFSNLVDAAPPASRVAPLPDGLPAAPFVVTWSGADDAHGSGLKAFDVFVRRGTDPDSLWIAGTSDTSAVFEGVLGATYAFYTVATDRTGQREAAPSTPDAVVTLGLQSTGAPPRPRVLALYGALPNPAREDLSVAFSLVSDGPATLELFDVAGRRVWSRAVGSLGPGQHVVRIGNERKIRSGIYVVRLNAEGRNLKTKAVVIQ